MSPRRLPVYIADGPEVSELAYRIVARALEGLEAVGTVDTFGVTLVEVVEHLAVELDVDEADVLRAWAELERVGALVVDRQPAIERGPDEQ
jgi:hypothetical protein